MTDHLAILDASTPSLSLEKAARSFYAERIPLAPPMPDRDVKWRWGVAIIAALLLHLGVVTTIDDGFQREKPPEQAPVPVEIVTEPPAPPPAAKPAEKPPAQQKPPEPQQPQPDLSSGGDQAHKAMGTPPPAPAVADKPPSPASPPLAAAPEPPAPTPAPALPTEASPQAVPVPPSSSPRDTQQAVIAPPVPPKKPPAPPERQVTTAPPQQSQAPAPSTLQDLRLGEGGGDKYLNALRDDIRRHQFYPPTAEMFRITGVATYDITIDRAGRLLSARLVESSGYDILDKAGFMTIKLSAPFDPVPRDFMADRDTIGLTLTLSMGPK